jgi:hypothetical protein
LEEVIPSDGRGTGLGPLGGFSTGGAHSHGENYEKAVISHVTHDCKALKPNCEARACVKFKRKACDNLWKSLVVARFSVGQERGRARSCVVAIDLIKFAPANVFAENKNSPLPWGGYCALRTSSR